MSCEVSCEAREATAPAEAEAMAADAVDEPVNGLANRHGDGVSSVHHRFGVCEFYGHLCLCREPTGPGLEHDPNPGHLCVVYVYAAEDTR